MAVEIRSVVTKSDLRKFIHLPEIIHKNHLTWMPPIYLDEWTFFNPKKNRAFDHSETTLVMAWKGEEPVGRIMGIINLKYNQIRNEKTARFGYLECWNDQDVAHALIGYIENWARGFGMTKLIGPYGFSDKDPQGFLIEGFEHMPLIASACNFPYMIDLVEKEGFTKELDCLIYTIQVEQEIAEIYYRVNQRILSRNEFRLLEFSRKKEIKPYIHPILDLLNESYSHIYGFTPLDQKEKEDFAKRYLPILDHHYVKAVLKGDEPVAFLIGIPNFTPGVQKSRGYLFPFGIFYIINSVKKSKQLDLMLVGIKSQYKGRGLDVMMSLAMLESIKARGIRTVEVHLMLETNTPVLSEMARVNGKVHKRFRVYQKGLV